MKNPTNLQCKQWLRSFVVNAVHSVKFGAERFAKLKATPQNSEFLGSVSNSKAISVLPMVMVMMLLFSVKAFAQLPVPFTPRLDGGSIKVKGDILFIGNSTVTGAGLPSPYNGNGINNNNEGVYINTASGGDPAIFSSSSADLTIDTDCKKILYAGLYWASVYPNEIGTNSNVGFEGTQRFEDWNQVKFKLPGGDFIDLEADSDPDMVGEEDDIIFDGYKYYGPNVEDSFKDSPIICYKNVTNLVQGLAEADGTYAVANLRATRGFRRGGCSAGWTLVVIYESPILPSKYITVFDGYAGVQNNTTLDIPVSGFQTLPAPYPVNANISVGALEGDIGIQGDSFRFKANSVANFTVLSDAINQANNFFNSTITINGVHNINRNPASLNTLGLDINNVKIPNPGNIVIPNDETGGALKLTTNGDGYGAFVTSFAVEIIEPKIVLTKIVEDEFGNNIGGQIVNLGQELNYVLGFRNSGNDDATDFTIRDILPINIVFDYPSDMTYLPPGVSVESYNPATREIVFRIDDSVVEEFDPVLEIRFKVTVVESCSLLVDVCSDLINNQAFATYRSSLNPSFLITDDPSYSSNTGCLLAPQATNFLADLNDCIFTEEIILCGDTVDITAANGYDSYAWSSSPTGTPVIGTTQTITVSNTGIYYVRNTAIAPCQSIDQIFNVELYGGTITNPVIPYADEVATCPNDGKLLPNIFLCGANDQRDIQTNISGATSIIWEQLDESSCGAVSNTDCANENSACTWNEVQTGPDFIADAAGQFRLTINYEGGCFTQFYFNVYQNLLDPTVATQDIVCTTPGSITVGGVPNGYEYSLDGASYQSSNIFSVNTPGFYTVYVRQVGVASNPCVFTVPDIQIRSRNFSGSTLVIQPYCNGDKGSIQIAANDANPQYTFTLYQGATLVNTVGPAMANNHTFENLNPGTYTASLTTEDGCTFSEDITIINPPILTVTAAITSPLTCNDGEITMYPSGGTPPYFYFVNSTTEFQTEPVFTVTAPGTFDITVVDANNCSATTNLVIDTIPPPDFTVNTTDITCASAGNTGGIDINVTAANGNSIQYSIDNGITFTNSSVFNGLDVGDYEVVVQYTSGNSVCFTDAQTVTITSATAISGTAELSANLTCANSATITVIDVVGGDAPYTYSIDGVNFQTSPDFTGLTAGTYTVTIKDANVCTSAANDITVAPLDPVTDISFDNTPLTCPLNVSTVSIINVVGGTGTLEYQIIAPASAQTAYQTSNEFQDLAPGTYTFQVKDANDCTYSESYTIAPLAAITVVGQNVNDISCFGAADASVQFTISGTANFNYTINGGASTAGTSPVVLTGLSAGSYTLIVTDTATNCNATETLTVNGPTSALAMTTTVAPITCLQNGSVVINATGGWGGNSYSLTLPDGSVLPGQSNNTFANLSQDGTYTVTVVDANNCTITDTLVLNPTEAPIASIDVASDLCYDGTNAATIEVSVTSGQAPYEYSLNGGAYQTSNIFADLVPGSYTVTVRDAYGCTVTLSTQTIAQQPSVNTALTKDLDCTASPDAVITGTIAGGTAPFTYSVSIDGGAYTSLGSTGSPFTYSTGTPGTYQFQISDAQGCTAQSGIITINPISPPALSLVTQTQPILCNGDTNAAIQINIDTTVGTPPFLTNVNNDTTGVDYGTQTSGLPAGTYTITVTDARFCTATDTVTIGEPDAIDFDLSKIDITCNNPGGSSLGSITVENTSGGTGPFTYFITNNFGDSIPNNPYTALTGEDYQFDIINFGIYTVNVVDSNGCNLSKQITIASPPSDLVIDVTPSVPDCVSGGTVTVEAISAVGSGSYEFGILEFNTVPYTLNYLGPDVPGGAIRTFNNLIPGVVYTFVVHDTTTDCYFVKSADIAIPAFSPLTSTVTPNNVSCTGNDNGSVTFTVDNFDNTTSSIEYSIYRAYTNILVDGPTNLPVTFGVPETVTTPTSLEVGQYYILFTENGTGAYSGCESSSVIFEITESPLLLSLSTSVDQNANCNASSGVISAVAQNGTPPYTYQVTTTATPIPLATDPAWASASTFNLDAGDYYVHAKDKYGCIVSSPVVVLPMDPTPAISAVITNQCDTVEGAYEIEVNLDTPGIAPYSFSIDGGAFQTQTAPFTLSNLSSGSHTVELQDANGCGNLVTVNIEAPIGLTPAVTALPSCTNNDGILTVTGTGGTGTYTYGISPNPASITLTGNVFSGVPSGTYTVTITDTVTSCTEDVSVTLDAATPVTFTTTVNDVSCNAGTNGVISVNLPSSNDNPVYTYEIIAPMVVPAQNSNVFSGLSAGTYTVQVTSGRGCAATQDVVVGEPELLQVSGTATDFACAIDNSVNTSTLAITEVGGMAPYTYSINGTNYFTSNTFDIIDTGSIQTITFFVKDANGCLASNTVTLNPLPTLTLAAVAIATPIDCNNTGTVSIAVTGGSGNVTYQMLPSGTPQASNTFSIIVPGDYYFQVNDIDTGCNVATAAITVAPYDEVDVNAVAISDVTCFGDANGGFEINLTGYTGEYSYEVLDAAGTSIIGTVTANTSTDPQTVSGLTAGNYTTVITETASPFCSATSNVVTITSPSAALTLDASETSNVTCTDDQGTITAEATGGWGTLEYELSGAASVAYSSNGSFSGLSAGAYTVTVRDAEGCEASVPVTLTLPTPIDATFTPSTTLLSCFGDQDASITVTNVTGGQGENFTYTLNTILPTASVSGPQGSNTFSNLAAGTYSVSITDGLNCVDTSADIVITEPTEVEASLVTATTQSCLIDPSLTLSATGGTPPYTYSATEGFATTLGTFTTSTTFDVAPGTYMYYVKDANGCLATVSNEITIEVLPTLILNLELTNATINCAGDNSGFIVASAQGGLGNYVYTLQDAGGTTIPATQNTPGTFTGLLAGNYIVMVESGDCAATSTPVSITEPTAPLEVTFDISNISCAGSDDGAIEINATGGTGQIKYAISPQLNQFFDTNVFSNLAAGTYDVIVQDVLGCYVNFSFEITEPVPVILSIVGNSIYPEVCEGDANGEFSVEISGGTLPYSVSLDDYDGTYATGAATQAQFDFTDLSGGDHSVFVRDAQGCESEWNITFPEAVRIESTVAVTYECFDNVTGNVVTVSVDESIDNLEDLDYALNGGPYQASNVFTNLVPGTDHYIEVRHTNGCIQITELFVIEAFDAMTMILEEGELNQIVAVVTGGTGQYEFTLNGESLGNVNTFTVSESGTYTMVVSDGSGCELVASIQMEFVDICIPNYFTPNSDGVSDGWAPGCSSQYTNLEFDIFDRYGRKVATLRQGQLWDGKYKGAELPTGDYWYVVRLNSPDMDRDFVGHFTLYR
ncbi:T9SS type B sorting domain-containing protein [Subsaximicrobium wynnwilliamsii]|uniref:T9SS type B sorting domain-containing protein n=1 Tax=Subsaximicrobium wynnwilliamsii TaxID=291179 RepID=A0A5C6ZBK9_9FLAO|nr:T9SS type B sorting domain-containing protein [Subsaximicrobium wynnwilliamsii]TXD81423.1 T9SS type B sorting domain-containing protein [Subsaximicrobium wynnwilliamsii]TXD87139.1 T9SS type B sorting domain-containing protein [Subsaximicrobium wynnwilliamsii]TXE00693.1 T9SS type B sorting domain-containing protein [Subsaximicrobium wynnwilliamsii]